VARDGQLAVGDEKVAEADFVQLVKLKVGGDVSRFVHLRGDKDVAYGRMVGVLDQLASNGITHIAIVTDAARSGVGEAVGAPGAPLPPK